MQPNILVLMADQLTAGALRAYGNRVSRTPHLDALAARAVVFDNAYCNIPLCAPSRASLMSGRLPSAIGAYDNACEFPSQTPTFAHVLRAAGYQTILAGKMHFCGPDQLHGFEERLTTDIYPADYAWTPDWTRAHDRPDWYHAMNSVTEAGLCIRTNQIDFDEEVVHAARQKLFDIARAPEQRPFCMVVSLSHPHDPFTIPDPWWSRHSDAEIDMPNPAAQDDPHSRRLRHAIGLDLLEPDATQIRAARRAYYGACAFVDDCAGQLLSTLDLCGLTDDTVIVLLSDHGEMLGDRGLWFKMNFFDPACRIPLMISNPRRFAPRRVAECVSLVDILPTFAELGGVPDPGIPLDGHSLLPHCRNEPAHDEAFGEYTAEGAIAPIVMIRRGRHKFIHCPADPDQLFDLATDPVERHNLASQGGAPNAGAPNIFDVFRAEAAARWDLPGLDAAIRASQRRRMLVNSALRRGTPHHWDHTPARDASQSYIRSHIPLDELEARARFPAVISEKTPLRSP